MIAAVGVLALALSLLPLAAPSADAQDHPEIDFERLEGQTRFQTAADIATSTYDASTDVVIASGQEFPDALAGASLEGDLDAPVLLVPRNLVNGSIPGEITAAIDELGATNAVFLGGTAAIDSEVEDYVLDNSTATTSERVAGSTRFETARDIAQQVSASPIPGGVADELDLPEGSTGAFVATGLNWPDALAGGAPAFDGPSPILLTTPDELHNSAQEGLAAADPDVVFILGGSAVVGPGVVSDLEAEGYEVERLSGADRWETAVDVAEAFLGDFGPEDVGLATGFEFADALASAPYLGGVPAPLVLTPTASTVPATEAFFDSLGCDLETIHVFGGQAAVQDSTAVAYANAACPEPVEPGGIEGTVTNAGTEEPEEGAELLLSNDVETSTVTDEDGFYEFTDVDAGDYTLTADAEGKVAETVDVTVEADEVTEVNFALEPEEPVGPGTFIDGPELIEANEVTVASDGAIVDYTFDDVVDGRTPDGTGFKLYPYNDTGDPLQSVETEVDTGSDTVRATFDFADDDRDRYDDVTVATVEEDVVHNRDDIANPEGEAPYADVTVVTEVDAATAAPDLMSVENVEPLDVLAPETVTVDFVFDEDAWGTELAEAGAGEVAEGDLEDDDDGYYLLLDDGTTVIECAYDGEDDGEDTHSVLCPQVDDELIDEGDIARGFVGTDTVTTDPGEAPVFSNALQAVDVSPPSDTPDLVGFDIISVDDDRALVDFEFDEEVRLGSGADDSDDAEEAATTGDEGQFRWYDNEAEQTDAERVRVRADRTLVRAQFDTGGDAELFDDFVGVNVLENAVTERFAPQRPNQPDEERADPDEPEERVITAGTTDAPDLIAVSDLEEIEDAFTEEFEAWRATFTFNAELDEALCDAANFRLYLEDGTQFTGDAEVECGEEDAENQAVIDFVDEDAGDAALGTVAWQAVAEDDDNEPNPEGARGVGTSFEYDA